MSKLLSSLLIIATVACAESSSPEPKAPLVETACRVSTVLMILGDNPDLVEAVLTQEMGIEEAVGLIGGAEGDIAAAIEHLNACKVPKS